MALGANRQRVVGLVVREGLALAGIGLALGTVGAYFVGRGMQSTLFGIGKIDLSVLLSVALVLMLVAGFACLIPALQANNADAGGSFAGATSPWRRWWMPAPASCAVAKPN